MQADLRSRACMKNKNFKILELISYTCAGQALLAEVDFGETTPSLIAGIEADGSELDFGNN